MLLTLHASCLRGMLAGSSKSSRSGLSLNDLPAFARETLGLHGLNLTTDMLAGWGRAQLEAFRERADKAGCSCLLLVESEMQALTDASAADAAVARMRRVMAAAGALGCNSAAMKVKAADSAPVLEVVAKRVKQIVESAEKLDLTLLIAPSAGLTSTPERLTELIKRVGGFRVGTFPDFQAASAAKDPTVYLRRLCPYAQVVSASTVRFKEAGKKLRDRPGQAADRTVFEHEPYDLGLLVKAVVSVGFEGTLAIDYRGDGDVITGVTKTRDALAAMLGGDSDEPEFDEETDFLAEGEDEDEAEDGEGDDEKVGKGE